MQTRRQKTIFRTRRVETFLTFNIIQAFLEKQSEGRPLKALQPVDELLPNLVNGYKKWPERKIITNLTSPLSVLIHNKNIYICESTLHYIVVINTQTNTQTILHTWGIHQSNFGNGIGQFKCPSSIAISKEGIIAVCDTGNHRVQLFENDGTFKIQYNTDLMNPCGVSFNDDGTIIAISDTGNHRIQIRKITGEIVRNIGQLGNGPGMLNTPAGITITKQNYIFVCDVINHRIQIFGPHGEFLKIIGQNELVSPVSISVLPSGEIFVADSKKMTIEGFRIYHVFNKEYKLIGTTSSKFFEKKSESLYGLFVEENGDIVVSHPHPNYHSITLFSNFNYHQHGEKKRIINEYIDSTTTLIKEEVYIKVIKQ